MTTEVQEKSTSKPVVAKAVTKKRKLQSNTKVVLKLCSLTAVPVGKTKPVTVTLYEDTSCEMAKIQVNNETAYEGNYWDFHPGCTGVALEFKGRHSLLALIVAGLKDAGYEVDEVYDDYVYD